MSQFQRAPIHSKSSDIKRYTSDKACAGLLLANAHISPLPQFRCKFRINNPSVARCISVSRHIKTRNLSLLLPNTQSCFYATADFLLVRLYTQRWPS